MELDPSVKSWIPLDKDGLYSIHNLPFGIGACRARNQASLTTHEAHTVVRIGDMVLSMVAVSQLPGAEELLPTIWKHSAQWGNNTLNEFAGLGRDVHARVRRELQRLLRDDTDVAHLLKDSGRPEHSYMLPVDQVLMHMPMRVRDYTDFYVGYHHAYKVGELFRGPERALQPNYMHMPVGYHGRASSLVEGGVPIRRPRGQRLVGEDTQPTTGPSLKLDFELELGCLIGKPTELGESVGVDEADEHIFGYVLLNDWSARDIQAWEYVPLGPFNGKNFGTSVGPWVVLAQVMEQFRAEPLENKSVLQPYLAERQKQSVFDINLQVSITTPADSQTVVTRTSSRNMLWSFPQMIAHHTLGGCALGLGDLLGSGTISGPEPHQRGSLLEMSEGGKQDVELSGGATRRFLEDGDVVTLGGYCERGGYRVGFGECTGKILPAKDTA